MAAGVPDFQSIERRTKRRRGREGMGRGELTNGGSEQSPLEAASRRIRPPSSDSEDLTCTVDGWKISFQNTELLSEKISI